MNRTSFVKPRLAVALLMACSSLGEPTLADDVEIFIRPSVEPIPPNVIFLLNESDHMTVEINGTSRLEIMKGAMEAIVNDDRNSNITAAIMALGQTTANDFSTPNTRIVKPFDKIGQNPDAWQDAIDSLSASTTHEDGNHLALTLPGLVSAAKWFDRGFLDQPSPLETEAKGNWCKPNIIIMLSDGGSFDYALNINNTGVEDLLDTSYELLTPPNGGATLEYIQNNWPIKSVPFLPYDPDVYVDSRVRPLTKTWSFNGDQCTAYPDDTPIYNPFDDYRYFITPTVIPVFDPPSYIGYFAGFEGGFCAEEFLSWATEHDLKGGGEWDWDSGDVSQSPETKRIQTIRFFTVDLTPSDSTYQSADREMFLNYIAQRGGGQYFTAANTAELAEAFQQILEEATKIVAYAYTAPTIPFNPDNAAISGEDIYVPIFEPNPHPLWYGNLKKFTLSFESTDSEDPNSPKKVVIKDANNAAVLNDGYFSESSADAWNLSSASPGKPLNGGAASHMGTQGTTRNLYTTFIEYTGSSLLSESNKISAQNAQIDANLLNVELLNLIDYSDSERRALILDWINWSDVTLPDGNGGSVTVSHKKKMGAPIHSKPVVVRTENESVVFITTTEGILHAINANTGDEIWAYMPKDLLPTLTKSFISDWNYSKPHNEEDGTPLDGHPHVLLPNYGLDGPLMTYEHEGRRYLVMGMRRGGRNYYALDITDPFNPLFAWKIEGGSDDFDKLGQTWSKPIYATLEFPGTSSSRNVLIIGGGYDPQEDDYFVDQNSNGVYDVGEPATARQDDQLGNVIYFVDPATGARINVGGFDGVIDSVVEGHMGNAIVADILPVDINANGIVDRLYAADVGGRIIRVDIPDHAIAALTGNQQISATVLADVNLTRTGDTYAQQDGSDYQRFFNTPEAAYFNKGGTQYLALLIGSGHLSRPLSDRVAHDRFYMIKDPNVWVAPADNDGDGNPDYPKVIAENDLYDTTANKVQVGNSGEQAQAASAIAAAHGWYFDINNGEKVYSPAKIYDYVVLFTTYEGISPSTDDACEAVYSNGISRFYAVNMSDGSAMFAEMNGQAGLQTSDRSKVINTPGLPSTPYILTPAAVDDQGRPKISGDILGMVGLQEVVRWQDRFHPISWEEVTGSSENDTPPACN